jgi:hypothetical protein
MNLGNSVQFYPSCRTSESDDVKRLKANPCSIVIFINGSIFISMEKQNIVGSELWSPKKYQIRRPQVTPYMKSCRNIPAPIERKVRKEVLLIL